MDTSKHTSGPWMQHGCFIWSPRALANIAALSALRPSHIIEYVPPELGDENLEEIYANGRLLAAAPELLEALKKWQHVWKNTECEEDDCAAASRMAEEAIAKATGA